MAQVLSSPGVKPKLWRVRKSRVAPEWQWVWDDLSFAIPNWEGDDTPKLYGPMAGRELTKVGTVTPGVRPKGRTTEHVRSDNDGAYEIAGDISGGPDGYTCTIAIQYDSTSDFQYLWDGRSANSTFLAIQFGSQVRYNGTSSEAFPESGFYVVTVTDDGTTGKAWVNGVSEITSATGAGAPDTNWRLLSRHTDAEQLNGGFYALYFHRRALSDAKALRLSRELLRDPFGPFRMGRRSMVFVPAAGGGTTSLPPVPRIFRNPLLRM